jgi:hypothetical protein
MVKKPSKPQQNKQTKNLFLCTNRIYMKIIFYNLYPNTVRKIKRLVVSKYNQYNSNNKTYIKQDTWQIYGIHPFSRSF